jgi:hypothetical protein
MDVLQQALEKVISSLPKVALESLISKKLRGQGIAFPKTLPSKLAERILSGAGEPFQHAGRTRLKDISLLFTEADTDEIARVVDNFLEVELPAFITVFAEGTAKSLLKDLKRRWAEEQELQQTDLSGFRSRMLETWGEPLSKLRMLLTIVREWCGEAHGKVPVVEARKRPQLAKLMVRLLVRACQVTDEILCLLENGFADGAMARWRTLHEIGVVAAALAKFDEDIAERYVVHQAVESKRAMKRYLDCYKELGYRPLGVQTIKRIEKKYDAAIAR